MPKVKFIQEKKEIEVPAGANLRDEAMKAGIELYSGPDKYLNCRGNGLCATCCVWLKNDTAKNASPIGILEKTRSKLGFYDIGHEDECRLSCKVQVRGDIEVWTRPEYNWFGETITAAAAPKPAAPVATTAGAAPAAHSAAPAAHSAAPTAGAASAAPSTPPAK